MKKVLSRTVLYALLILAVFFTACRAASSSKVKPMPVCGNGIKEEGETWQNCPSDCNLPVCGNGVIEDGEECDNGHQHTSCCRNCMIDTSTPACTSN
ncbi:MAG: hypothetical protein IK002_05150 [Treponema sp.]|uniref:hypothetical protein n=1 Tax=Treponema sp. TaxID=166 RepID=UPI00298E59EE|nr:hypothetical protein [Treponema sp.]MBR5933356.1 hypothetical protein [Treponema sp.]